MKKRAGATLKRATKLAQQINDSLSASASSATGVETARYIAALLEKNGFTVERGVAGMPSAWVGALEHGQGGRL